jgi:hypothetical protein
MKLHNGAMTMTTAPPASWFRHVPFCAEQYRLAVEMKRRSTNDFMPLLQNASQKQHRRTASQQRWCPHLHQKTRGLAQQSLGLSDNLFDFHLALNM